MWGGLNVPLAMLEKYEINFFGLDLEFFCVEYS